MSDSDPISGAILRTISDAIPDHVGAEAMEPTLYVGYSGGLDSTVLLHAAHRLYGQRVVALHVNHGLHADAASWQRHCARVCGEWQIELRSREVTVSDGNMEAAARAARYAYFEETLDTGDVVLLAHHQDDQAETILLRIAQGRGLIGMPVQRRVGSGRLLRPLLQIPRRGLEAYAQAWRLAWIQDPSNADLDLDRNYLRAGVMPGLAARWPDIGAALADLLAARRAVDEMLLGHLDPASSMLPMKDLIQDSEPATLELLRVWLQARGAVAPSGRALRSFVAQLGAPADRQPALSLNAGSLRRYRECVHHVSDPPQLEPRYALQAPGFLVLPHGVLKVVPSGNGGFAPCGDLSVVFRGAGGTPDALMLRGHRRELNKLLQEAGVPPWERDTYPLLEDRDGIVAVPGIAVRDDAAAGTGRWQANWLPLFR